MKQIDRIRNMNAEELATEIYDNDDRNIDMCAFCIGCDKILVNMTCIDGIKAWFESEVEE